jgi:hypothetical protein
MCGRSIAPHPHRPPDVHVACLEYPRLLSNTYFFLDLRRPRRLSHRALALTRSGAGVDLPGFGRGRRDMSDQEDTQGAQTARGGSRSHGGHALAREDDHGRPWSRGDFVPADDPGWS